MFIFQHQKFNLPMKQISNFILLLLFMVFDVKAQYPSSQNGYPVRDAPANFQPGLAVVISVLAIIFCSTFILLVYAKFCHRSSSPNNQQIQDGFSRSGAQFSGIDKTVIESLPFFRFSSLMGSREGLECSVCLSKFEDIETLRLLPKCKHAFHIDCVDQWLERHSSCPLCRNKVSADDLSLVTYSNSFRFLWNQSEVPEESNFELFVQREEDHRGSSRFSIGSSFRKFHKEKKEEELPIQENFDTDENSRLLHKLNHKIIVSDLFLKNRWSSINSSDIMSLNSEMINSMSSNRFSALDSIKDQSDKQIMMEDGHIMNIKEEMERKIMFDSEFSKINQSDSFPFSNHPSVSEFESNPSYKSKVLSPGEKRSMSEITVHPRFKELNMKNSTRGGSFPGNNVEEERVRRLWLPIARKTVQWVANREKSTPQTLKGSITDRL